MSAEQRLELDLSTCDREPIHIPGAIQPHGVLLALEERDLVVVQASDNLESRLGVSASTAVGKPLAAVLGDLVAGAIRRALGSGPAPENPVRLLLRGSMHDAVLHRSDGVVVVEIEPSAEECAADRNRHPIENAMVQIQSADALQRLCDVVVEEVRKLTGFERVMVYQFDEGGHGFVRAEVKAEGLDAYLGLHYPASDIPRPARELYLKNWLRIIPDARYSPAALCPPLRPDGRPLELSHAVLRSVSPVHLEYLANMGVRASMSVSLIVHGRLWGLISCAHHTDPRFVPHAVRADCELMGRLMSLQLSALEDREVASRRTQRRPALAMLAGAMQADDSVLHALVQRPSELLDLVGATGAAIVHEIEVLTVGRTPPPGAVGEIAGWLDGRGGEEVFATACLSEELAEAEAFKDAASGVLSFALPGPLPRRLLWFRPEMRETVNWGGDPHKPVEQMAGARLHPRRSFELWREEVRLRSRRWDAATVEAAADLRRLAIEIDLEKQVRRERRAVRARDDLVAVVSHDLKNPLNVIGMQAAILRAAAGGDQEESAQRVRASVERIQRSVDHMNSLIHNLLDLAKIEAGRFEVQRTRENIPEVVEETLAILRPLAEAKHVALVAEQLEDVTLSLDRDRIFQVLSNLVGNAIKFTGEGGRVSLRVSREADVVLFTVTDSGPGVDPAHLPHLFERYWQAPATKRSGTGLGLYIAKGIVEAHGGRIWASLPSGGGACFQFTLPARR